MSNSYERWANAEIGNKQALEELCRSLATVEDNLDGWSQQREALRAQISEVVERGFEGRAELPGFGKLTIQEASITETYDKAAMDKLVVRLVADGYGDIAQEIARCKKQSMRAGGLRIVRAKE